MSAQRIPRPPVPLVRIIPIEVRPAVRPMQVVARIRCPECRSTTPQIEINAVRQNIKHYRCYVCKAAGRVYTFKVRVIDPLKPG